MSRTFSLSRLMVGVTVFCVLCGLAVNFPEAAIACVLIALVSTPTAITWLVLARFSKRRGLLACNVLAGAFIGFMLFAPGNMGVGPRTWWIEYMSVVVPPAFGAFVLGFATLLDELLPARK